MVWPYLTAVLLFLILIIIHEFGHFIAAKLLGVKVNEFAVGFGPRLFGVKGKETTYSFNASIAIKIKTNIAITNAIIDVTNGLAFKKFYLYYVFLWRERRNSVQNCLS